MMANAQTPVRSAIRSELSKSVITKKLMSIFDISLQAAQITYNWAYVALVVGAGLTVIGLLALFLAEGVKHKHQELKLAEAKASAAAATERAAVANERAAQLEKEAATARLELAKINERLADRTLTAAQQASLAQKLAPFAGQKVNVVGPPGNKEVEKIANQVLGALNKAKWLFKVSIGHDQARAVSGILIELMPNADPQSLKAAQALADALRAEGLVTVGPAPHNPQAITGMFTGESLPDAQTRLVFGPK